jgi:putative lipoic acid-binding regulatory protein
MLTVVKVVRCLLVSILASHSEHFVPAGRRYSKDKSKTGKFTSISVDVQVKDSQEILNT